MPELLADPLQSHIDLLATARGKRFGTILADPPWQFQNRTGKIAPEQKRLNRYGTITLDDICAAYFTISALPSKPSRVTPARFTAAIV